MTQNGGTEITEIPRFQTSHHAAVRNAFSSSVFMTVPSEATLNLYVL